MADLKFLGWASFVVVTGIHFLMAAKDRTYLFDALSMVVVTTLYYRWPESQLIVWTAVVSAAALKTCGVVARRRRGRSRAAGADALE